MLTTNEISIICNLDQQEQQQLSQLYQLIIQSSEQICHVERVVVLKYTQTTIDVLKLGTGEQKTINWQNLQYYLQGQPKDYYHKILKLIYKNNQIIYISLDQQKDVLNLQNILNLLKIPNSDDNILSKRVNKLYRIDEANSFNVFSENIFATSINNEDDEEFNAVNLEEDVFQPVIDTNQVENKLRMSNSEEEYQYGDQNSSRNETDQKKFKFSDRPDTQNSQQKSQLSNTIISPLARPRSSSGILFHQKQLISTQIYCFGRVELQLENTVFITIPEKYYNINVKDMLENKQEIIEYLQSYQLKEGQYLVVSGIQQNVKNGDIVKLELQPFSYELTSFQSIRDQIGMFEIYAQNIEIIQQLTLQDQHKHYFIEGNTYQGIVYSYNDKDNFGFIKSVGEHKQSNNLCQGLELYFKNSQSRPKNQIFQVGDLVTFKCHWMNDRPQARDIILTGSCINQNLQSIILSITQNYIICQLTQHQHNELLNQNLIFMKKRGDQHKENMSQSSVQSQIKQLQIGQQILINTTVDISGQLKFTSFNKMENQNKQLIQKYIKFYSIVQFSKNYPFLLENQCKSQLIKIDKQIQLQNQYQVSFYGYVQNYIVWKCIDQNLLLLIDKNQIDIQTCYKKELIIDIQNTLFQEQTNDVYQLDNQLAIIVNNFRIL